MPKHLGMLHMGLQLSGGKRPLGEASQGSGGNAAWQAFASVPLLFQ